MSPGESAQFGQIALGVALPNVDGEIGDSLCVPSVLTQRARPQCSAGSGDGLVDRMFGDGAHAAGQ